MIEYGRQINDDSWKGKEDGTHKNWVPSFHTGKPLAPWARSFSARLLMGGDTKIVELSSQVSPYLELEVERHVQAVAGNAGMIPVDLERALNLGVEVFLLSEECAVEPSCIAALWRHSLRTGCLAARIALHLGSNSRMVWQSFVGGVLHDIGMLVFLTQHPGAFRAVVEGSQCRGESLAVLEKRVLGYTHGESGATFLARWGIDDVLLAIAAFHDDPWNAPCATFGPLTAVYAGNFVEGGGIGQDGDGVIGGKGEAYLTRLGLWDDLPIWQSWMPGISQLAIH